MSRLHPLHSFVKSLINSFCFRCPRCGSVCCDVADCQRCGWSE